MIQIPQFSWWLNSGFSFFYKYFQCKYIQRYILINIEKLAVESCIQFYLLNFKSGNNITHQHCHNNAHIHMISYLDYILPVFFQCSNNIQMNFLFMFNVYLMTIILFVLLTYKKRSLKLRKTITSLSLLYGVFRQCFILIHK